MIELNNIHFAYKGQTDAFSLSVPALKMAQGDRAAVVGPSGSGKSTLLNLLSGIHTAQRGLIRVAGHRLDEMSESQRRLFRRSQLGFVFQDIALFDYLSVLENVLLPYRLAPINSKDIMTEAVATERAIALLTHVGMQGKITRKPSMLSQGERQRVGICRAMLLKPQVLLADEPTSSLDERNSDLVTDYLIAMSRDEGTTLLMLTHEQRLLQRFDRVIEMSELTAHTEDSPQPKESTSPPTDTPKVEPLSASGHLFSHLGIVRRLTVSSLRHDRMRSALMILALMLAILLPVVTVVLVQAFQTGLMRRAETTPMVVGRRGGEMDLILKLLYFSSSGQQSGQKTTLTSLMRYGEYETLLSQGEDLKDLKLVPLHAVYTVDQSLPLIGTDIDYFQVRGMSIDHGQLPALTGQTVLGASAAEQLRQRHRLSHVSDLIGRSLRTDVSSLHDLSRNLSVSLRVTGVFRPTMERDDQAVYVSLPTAWIVAGLGHGHEESRALSKEDQALVVEDGRQVTQLSGRVRNEVNIDQANVENVHFHGDQNDYPLSGLLVFAASDKTRTIFKSRINERDARLQVTVPREAVSLLMEKIFRLKSFFYINMLAVILAMGLLVLLVSNLSAKLRRRERQTLDRMGASQWIWRGMLFAENGVLLMVASVVPLIFFLYCINNPGPFFRYMLEMIR